MLQLKAATENVFVIRVRDKMHVNVPRSFSAGMARPATHTCRGRGQFKDKENILVTVYEPDPSEWQADFKRRKVS